MPKNKIEEHEQPLEELNSARRGSQAKCQYKRVNTLHETN